MKKFLLLIALIISGLGLNAQSVGSSSIVYYDGYSLKFTVTKLDPAECKVVCDTEPTTPVAVSIPSSVTIEGSTFSVTSIGYSAFSNCLLTSIEIPNSVTSIGIEAFSSCSNLESIVVESGNTVYVSPDAIGENADNNISIYPNPTDDVVNVVCKNMKDITIMSMTGQVVGYKDVNDDNAVVDMKDYPQSVYILMIRKDDGSIIRKNIDYNK